VQLESSLSDRKGKHSEVSGGTRIGLGDCQGKVIGLVTDSQTWWALDCVRDTKTEGASFRLPKLITINYDTGKTWEERVED